jgi:hypothetical protein
MAQTLLSKNAALQADPSDLIDLDRRREGRHDVAPQLLPLLRAPAPGEELSEDLRHLLDETEPSHEDDGSWEPLDPIAPARGVALAVGLSLPLWGMIGGLLYMMLR